MMDTTNFGALRWTPIQSIGEFDLAVSLLRRLNAAADRLAGVCRPFCRRTVCRMAGTAFTLSSRLGDRRHLRNVGHALLHAGVVINPKSRGCKGQTLMMWRSIAFAACMVAGSILLLLSASRARSETIRGSTLTICT